MNSNINSIAQRTDEKIEIECKSDFLTGMYLITRIADCDLDENALLTIQDDCPDFILPFNYKRVNGQIEFTYKVGSLCKLQYFYGDVSHVEYVALWRGFLSPLLECRDWFMNPCSFVLNTDYIYFDKNKNSVVYVYIPTLNGCSGYGAFNEMASEISRSIKVADPNLENKVLRSIINDFEPERFLKMLLEHTRENSQCSTENPVWGKRDSACEDNRLPNLSGGEDESVSNVTEISNAKEIIEGEENTATMPRQKILEKIKGTESVFGVFGNKNRKKKETKRNGFKNEMPGSIPIVASIKPAPVSDVTQETKVLAANTGLQCIGGANYPQVIDVNIKEGEIFTIGRHDKNIGRKRSNFEFEARTKAISRRHAAIERTSTGYRLLDLSSSAGTYINDRKMPPNVPLEIKQGNRISFGNLGADYVWQDA